MTRRPLTLLLVVLLLASLVPNLAAAAPPDRIEPGLLDQLERGEVDRFVVEFAADADLDAAFGMRDRDRRGRFVLDRLRATSAKSQAVAIAHAAAAGAEATSYWLTNVLVVEGDAALAGALAAQPGVAQVRAEKRAQVVEPVKGTPRGPGGPVSTAGLAPEWGVAKIGAPAAWEAGVLGGGVVVANIDTGVDFDHEALVSSYRGNLGSGTFSHDYNWWDPSGICGDTPCDNAEHGTHTMGTMVGGDGPGPFEPDTGVAPGAQWIAAKGCEDFFCTEESLLSSGQWILAPTDLDGLNPDPSKRPDIVNNSWGGGSGEDWYLGIVEAWRAAGIVPVFSAGNSGPGCETGGSPGDYLASYSVGATDIDDVIADFSSRGPSPFGKGMPDVSAPGVDVTSTVPGNGYAAFSGTSMAAPHVAGSLALMMSAAAELVGDVDAVTEMLSATALDIPDDQCGGDPSGDPNNVYGDGRIDAATAVDLVANGGTLTGTVTDFDTTDPIAGATVTATSDASGRDFATVSSGDGTYSLFLPAGDYTVVVTAFGYAPSPGDPVTIETDLTTPHDVALVALPRFTAQGTVTRAEDGAPAEGVEVHALATPLAPAVTDGAGHYELELPIGTYTLAADPGGCATGTDGMVSSATESEVVMLDLEVVRKLDDFGYGCGPVDFAWIDATDETGAFGDDNAARVRLPFTFPFYDDDHTRAYVTSNGYLTFEPTSFSEYVNGEIPDPFPPNAAIYPLWQDLVIDETAAIETLATEVDGLAVFVIEWADVEVYGGTVRGSFEVQLWEDGRIDVLWGPDNPGALTGRGASIGIESSEGATGLQYGFREPVAVPGTAVRFEKLPTGTVSGTVTDANDGLPIEDATVTATPSGRQARTGEDGTYDLGLLPGTYDLTVSAPLYVAETSADVEVVVDEVTTVNAALTAPVATVNPLAIAHEVDFAEVGETVLTISNDGTAPLTWELRERDRGSAGPVLPTTDTSARHPRTWEPRGPRPDVQQASTGDVDPDDLDLVIDDPEGDAVFGPVDITTVRAGSDTTQMAMAIDLSGDTPMAEIGGFVFFDVDQDAETGLPPEYLYGDPAQDVGIDYFADMFGVSYAEPFVSIWDHNEEFVTEVPATVDGTTIVFAVPLEALDETGDGTIDTAMVLGDSWGPTDWAPDAGHGTIEAFTDVPWITFEPAGGTLDPAETVEVPVTVGGPNVQPGSYSAQLVLVSDAPRQQGLTLDVELDVALPAEFGRVTGTVYDAWSYEPLRADVTVAAEWQSTAVALSSRTAADGSFEVLAPTGTWPTHVSREGYENVVVTATVASGQTTDLGEVLLRPLRPLASLDRDVVDLHLTPEGASTTTLRLHNDGPVPLGFEVFEFGGSGTDAETAVGSAGAGRPAATWSRPARPDVAPRRYGAAAIDLGSLPTIIDDPDDDGARPVEVTAVRGGSDGSELGLAIDLSHDSPMDELGGFIFLDTDQNPDTGLAPVELGGSSTQDVGADYFLDLWDVSYSGEVWVLDANYESVGIVSAEIDGTTIGVGLALDLIGDDGFVDVAGVLGDYDDYSDWFPDAGHGTATLLDSDVPWLAVTPTSGAVAADSSRPLKLTVDPAGLDYGTHTASLFIRTDDPWAGTMRVDITVDVVPTTPLVSVAATAAQVTEDGPGTELKITRTSGETELDVGYVVGGTATPGKDFTGPDGGGTLRAGSGGTVHFDAGQLTASLSVVPIDDGEHEGPETITLTLRPGTGHALGTKDRVTLTILDDEAPLIEEIRRLAGDDRFLTAAAISQHAFGEGEAPAVVLARSDVFADALAGAPLAASLRAPLLLTRPDELHPVTADELVRVLPAGATVHMLGGEAALSQSVADAVAALGFEVVRTAGATRYETAIAIAERLDDPGTVLIATGENFPDALAAGAAAAAVGGAVVLTPTDAPHPATDAYLAANPELPRYAVGGPAARAYPSVAPVFGADRVATALAVAERFFDGPVAVGVARKDEFADALTGAAHIARWSGPMLLTGSETLDADVAAYLSANADAIVAAYLYGGEVALTKAVLDAVVAALA